MSEATPTTPATITPAPLAPVTPAAPITPVTAPQDCTLTFGTRLGLEALQRAGKLFSTSPLVPKEYQGADGLASCAIALDLANRIGANPLMVMQNLYIVHGRPGWSSKFKIAIFNQCGRFSPIRYEFSGTEGQDDWGCRAWAVEKATGQRIDGPKITIGLAKAEQWVNKPGSKWKTMPEQMLRYRSAGWLVDTVAPELGMGLPMADELEDIDGEVIPDPPQAGAIGAAMQTLPPPAEGSKPAPVATGSGRLARLKQQPKDVTPSDEPQTPAGSDAPASEDVPWPEE